VQNGGGWGANRFPFSVKVQLPKKRTYSRISQGLTSPLLKQRRNAEERRPRCHPVFNLNPITEDETTLVDSSSSDEEVYQHAYNNGEVLKSPSYRKFRHIKHVINPGNEVHPMMLPQRIDTRNSNFNSDRWKKWVPQRSPPTRPRLNPISTAPSLTSPKARFPSRHPLIMSPRLTLSANASRVRLPEKVDEVSSSSVLYLKGEVVDISTKLDDLEDKIDDWIDFLTINPRHRKKKRLNPRHQRLASNEVWFTYSEQDISQISTWNTQAGSETEEFSPSPSNFKTICRSASPIMRGIKRKPFRRRSSSIKRVDTELKRDAEEVNVVFQSYKRYEGPLMGGRTLKGKPNKNRFDSICLDKKPRFPSSFSLTELPEHALVETSETESTSSISTSSINESSADSSLLSVPALPTSITSDGLTIDENFFEIPGLQAQGEAYEKRWHKRFDEPTKQYNNLPENFIESFWEDFQAADWSSSAENV